MYIQGDEDDGAENPDDSPSGDSQIGSNGQTSDPFATSNSSNIGGDNNDENPAEENSDQEEVRSYINFKNLGLTIENYQEMEDTVICLCLIELGIFYSSLSIPAI